MFTDDLKSALLHHTIRRRESYRNFKNDQRCYMVRCISDDCHFRHRSKKCSDGSYTVSKIVAHSCTADIHTQWHGYNSVKHLQPTYQSYLENNARAAPGHIVASERSKGRSVKYLQANRALHAANVISDGNDIESFRKLPSMLERMVEAEAVTDRQSFYRMEVEQGAFHRLFFCPGASIEAFRFCRHSVSIDGTFWKNRWSLTLLLAVVLGW